MIPLLFILAALAATPERTGAVTDVAEFIPEESQRVLEAELEAYREATGFDVAILVIDDIPNASDPCEFATQVRKEWNLGGPERAGVLYLVVPPPVKKACLATGPGARPYLSDTEAVSIIDRVAKPLNLEERRVEAIAAATEAILTELGDTPVAERSPPPQPAQPFVDRSSSHRSSAATDDEVTTFACVCAVITVAFIRFLWWLFSRGNGYRGSGGSWAGRNHRRKTRSWDSHNSSTIFVSSSTVDVGGGGDSSGGGGDGGGGAGGDSG